MSAATTSPPARRWLTFSLRTFLIVTLALSLVLGYFGRVWLKAYRDSQPPTLYELAQIAKRHGIPMPPPRAKLVQGMYGYINGPVYSPAFLLNQNPDGSVDLLFGSEQKILHPNDVSAGALWHEMPADSSLKQPRWSYARDSTFVCAAQLADRGEHENAAMVSQQLLENARTIYGPAEFTIEPSDLRFTMARCAYANYARLLQTQPQRWADLRTRLNALMAEFPELGKGPCGDVYRDLALAVDAPAPEAGSTEALLLEWSQLNADSIGWPFDMATLYEDEEADPEYRNNAPAREIVRRGFDAIPNLIALRGDQRLTAHRGVSVADGTPELRRLGGLADDLLKRISGFSAFNSGASLSIPFPDEEANPDSQTWRHWFVEAKAQGEREYLLTNLYEDSLPGGLCEPLAYILAEKHPDSLFDLVSEYFQAPERRGDVYELVLPIRDANLPVQQRVELLVALFQKAPPEERERILSALARLDQKRATYFTLQLLDEFPVDVEGEYEDSPEAELAVVVNGLDDERAWRSLLQAARHASVGLRLEILENLGYRNANQRRRAYRLALLGAFLDDEAAGKRTMPGIDGRTTRVRTTVCDLATDTLAWLLSIERHTGRERTPEQWSDLRDQVRERLKQEKLPALE